MKAPDGGHGPRVRRPGRGEHPGQVTAALGKGGEQARRSVLPAQHLQDPELARAAPVTAVQAAADEDAGRDPVPASRHTASLTSRADPRQCSAIVARLASFSASTSGVRASRERPERRAARSSLVPAGQHRAQRHVPSRTMPGVPAPTARSRAGGTRPPPGTAPGPGASPPAAPARPLGADLDACPCRTSPSRSASMTRDRVDADVDPGHEPAVGVEAEAPRRPPGAARFRRQLAHHPRRTNSSTTSSTVGRDSPVTR